MSWDNRGIFFYRAQKFSVTDNEGHRKFDNLPYHEKMKLVHKDLCWHEQRNRNQMNLDYYRKREEDIKHLKCLMEHEFVKFRMKYLGL